MAKAQAENHFSSEIVYGLHERPPFGASAFAAAQHFLAIIVGIMTPPLIIGNALGFSSTTTAYLISMSLFVSGLATFVQCRRFGPVGSGLLSIQGTSFAFLGTIIAVGFDLKGQGLDENAILATIFGVCFFASSVEMILSRFIPYLRKVITPLVSGIVVTLIGLSLIKVGISDFGGGVWLLNNKPELFASPQNLGLGFLVLAIIVALNRSTNQYLRMAAIVIGLAVGYAVAAYMGKVSFDKLDGAAWFAAPHPFKYGMWRFDIGAFIPMAFLFIITSVETIGDLTATSMISKQPIEGDKYMRTIQRGVLADGTNSAMAAFFNCFPVTTFSQNNGVIQLTGVASRYVGFFIAGLLVLCGLVPFVATLFSIIPNSVLGGATILMFGTVAAAGVKIMASATINRRGMMIIAISMGLGLGVAFVPEILRPFPPTIKSIFGSSITTGGLTAMLCNIVLPRTKEALKPIAEDPEIVDVP
ncbi:xanthine permease XanP [bacterium DOLJORAL78_65_58]|nr:MAG: xanthine permease XanP [bacterium DOLZORAL124_64_63]PIE76474.1 MAG: xanthine permease XanP [bacterium DOLJORAL78_65_58]